MREKFNTYTLSRPRLRKTTGWFLVAIGFLALVTPLTPGGILFFVGLEILGLRIVFTEKIQRHFPRAHTFLQSFRLRKSPVTMGTPVASEIVVK